MIYENINTIECKFDKNIKCILKYINPYSREEKLIIKVEDVKSVQSPSKTSIFVHEEPNTLSLNFTSYKTFSCNIMELEDKSNLVFCKRERKT